MAVHHPLVFGTLSTILQQDVDKSSDSVDNYASLYRMRASIASDFAEWNQIVKMQQKDLQKTGTKWNCDSSI